MNSVCLVGNLTKDAELKYTASGTAVSKFTLAVNEKIKGEEKAHFFDLVQWGKGAEALAQYLTKGKKIAVTGKLQQNRWQDTEGKTRSKVEIWVNDVTFCGGQSTGQGSGQVQRVLSGPSIADDVIPF